MTDISRLSTGSNLHFVYPNVSEMNRKGRRGVLERAEQAREAGCSFVEMPCDFIKNVSEARLTGYPIGSFLDKQAVRLLYHPGIAQDIGYILHTEPSLPRRNQDRMLVQAPLCWHDHKWTDDFILMVLEVANYLGSAPFAIEIHPGYRRNTLGDLVDACRSIRNRFAEGYADAPLILIENRTGQFIATGVEIQAFWEYLNVHAPDLTSFVGVVLDIQQLHTQTRSAFEDNLARIPMESIKGLHIHARHQVPSFEDMIPWSRISEWFLRIPRPILVNPEIHHANRVNDAVAFCKTLLHYHGSQA